MSGKLMTDFLQEIQETKDSDIIDKSLLELQKIHRKSVR